MSVNVASLCAFQIQTLQFESNTCQSKTLLVWHNGCWLTWIADHWPSKARDHLPQSTQQRATRTRGVTMSSYRFRRWSLWLVIYERLAQSVPEVFMRCVIHSADAIEASYGNQQDDWQSLECTLDSHEIFDMWDDCNMEQHISWRSVYEHDG